MLNQLNYRLTALLLSFFLLSLKVVAQPVLPDLASVTQNGINILTWTCQYDGVKSVAVMRSNDSNFNYVTIGYVKDVKKGTQFYLDGHPKPGANWYKVTLVFGSNLSWTSNRIKIQVDSAQIAKGRVLPSNDSLQNLAVKLRTKTVKVDTSSGKDSLTAAKQKAVVVNTSVTKPAARDSIAAPVIPTIQIPDIEQVNAYTYIKSQYVFTNPFTGHVNVEISDAKTARYSIDFYDNSDVKVLEVPRITEPNVIIDKRNFQRTGMYKFELTKDKTRIETGYITIY